MSSGLALAIFGFYGSVLLFDLVPDNGLDYTASLTLVKGYG